MKKNPWVIIAVVQFFVIISLMSCSNNPLGVQEAGADPQPTASATPDPIQAAEVMVDLSKTNMRGVSREEENTNLQDYINQTEPALSDFLPGKTWTVKYFKNGNEKTGYITFNADGTFECDTIAGFIIDPLWGVMLDMSPIGYRVVNNSLEFKFYRNSEVKFVYIDFSEIKENRLKIPPSIWHINGHTQHSAAILTPQE